MTWKIGDWCVFDLDIVQITEIRDGGGMSVSEGQFTTSGMLEDRLRPLTLRNKSTIEWVAYYYKELGKLRGDDGFNYPDIHQHFCNLSRRAMDGDPNDRAAQDQIMEFCLAAKKYTPMIQGVHLFRDHR